MSDIRSSAIDSNTHNIYEDGWLQKALSSGAELVAGVSNQAQVSGEQPPVVDFDGLDFLRERNVHHARCLVAKARFVTSGGFRDEKIAEVLGPLCEDAQFQPLLDFIGRSLGEYHEAAIEVVREGDVIVGLHPLPVKDYRVVTEAGSRDYHYQIRSKSGGFVYSAGLKFARYGEKAEMLSRLGIDAEDADGVSEVIRFSRDRYVLSEVYGTPEWLASVPYMELETCQTQYRFDFFFNGCIPDGIYTVYKGLMQEDDWNNLKSELQAHQGPGNRRKLMVVNVGGDEIEVQFDKLDSESEGTADSEAQSVANAMAVVTAHGVPPLIAGIQVPGKMGGNNEFPNALQAFHAQYANPVQTYMSGVLAATLGSPKLNGGLKVSSDMFLGKTSDEKEPDPEDPTGMKMRPKNHRGNGFWTILDSIDVDKADTISRMKQPLGEATAQGRDLKAGAAQRGSDKRAGRGDRR